LISKGRHNKMYRLIFITCCSIFKIVTDIINLTEEYKENFEVVGFIDDNPELKGKIINNFEVLGGIDDIEQIIKEHNITDAVICLPEGYIKIRKKYYDICKEKGLSMPNFIHPSSVIAGDVRIGDGLICCANSVINPGSIIGNNVIIWTGTTIDHDNFISNHVYISPGVHLAGGVKVNECVMIGTGAIVTPQIIIGSNVIIGAASLVNKDVIDNVTLYGIPARIIRKNN